MFNLSRIQPNVSAQGVTHGRQQKVDNVCALLSGRTKKRLICQDCSDMKTNCITHNTRFIICYADPLAAEPFVMWRRSSALW